MGKLTVVVTRFLSLCAVLLALSVSTGGVALIPSTALAQPALSVTESDLNEWCIRHGADEARLINQTAYGWACYTGGTLSGIDMLALCQDKHPGQNSVDFMRDFYDPLSWECFGPVELLGGLNLPQYCVDHGFVNVGLRGSTVEAWNCIASDGTSQPIHTYPTDAAMPLSMAQACGEQYNLPIVRARVADHYNANAVQCWGSAETPSVPAVPSDLSVFMTSDGAGIGVSWTDNSDNEEGFDIGYSPTQDSSSIEHELVGPNQTFLSSDWGLNHDQNGLLAPGQTMCFQVSAYNAAGSSVPTPWSCITISSQLTLSLNQSSFQPGDTQILTATVTPGDSSSPVDFYLVLQAPDQTLLFYQSDGSLTQEAQPLLGNWTVTPISGELFRHAFTGAEQAGTHTWSSFFTDPGTLNVIGDLAQVPFTFIPVSRTPAGKAPNLVVLVHGCCTDADDVKEDWDSFGRRIAETITPSQTPEAWEIVVWDWHEDTTELYPGPAYLKAELQAADLAAAISSYYTYVHMIGHSAGARLIDLAAKNLVNLYNNVPSLKNRPFIHLTFLDAYTPNNDDYGFLKNYPNHYSEHYVDRTLSQVPDWITLTNKLLPNAFNFDITDWQPDNSEEKEKKEQDWGHQWPRYWYEKSVTTSGFRCGFALSVEGGNNQINMLPKQNPPEEPARKLKNTDCESGDVPPPPLPTPRPTPSP